MRILQTLAILSAEATLSNSFFLGKTVSDHVHIDHQKQQKQPLGGHTGQWYRDRCTEIKQRCETRREEVEGAHDEVIRRYEKEYRHETEVLGRAEDEADGAVAEAADQKLKVKRHKERVEEAKTTYVRTQDCPAGLRRLEDELHDLLAEPNDSEDDIDEECRKRKEILVKQKCVDDFVEARAVLKRVKETYSEERDELSEDREAAKRAKDALGPHEDDVDVAKKILDEERRRGVGKPLQRINEHCEEEMRTLKRMADGEVAEAEDAYERHKKLVDSKEEHYDEAQDDVDDRLDKIKDLQEKLAKAQARADEHRHCVSELQELREELVKLKSIPNETPEHIEEECQKKKLILKKERCVEEYHEAMDEVRRLEAKYRYAKEKLRKEKRYSRTVKSTKEQYEETLERFKHALEDAKDARDELNDCSEGGFPDVGDVRPDAPEAKPRRESGATVGHPTTWSLMIVTLAVVALLQP